MSHNLRIEDTKGNESEKRRRRRRENGDVKNPIRVVSSLGEGNLLDRFQSAVSEKEKKRKKIDKNERIRQRQKEKRERELAKFKNEINALLDDEGPSLKPSEKMTTFVPKMKGTVKGKFEELERKKQEDERKKAENERKRRNEKDMRDRKMIEIEIARKKLQEKQEEITNHEGETSENVKVATSKKMPGKLNAGNFEEIARKKEEKERKKAELERKFKMEAERRSIKEVHIQNMNIDSSESDKEIAPEETKTREKPKKLTTRFDEIARANDEEQRRKTGEENRRKLEEEKVMMREARMAAIESDSGSEVSSSESAENTTRKPSRLSTNLTKFDEIAKERMEDERKRIQERRKKLLEEEMKIFEESKKNFVQDDESGEEEQKAEVSKRTQPRRLDSSFTNFDIMTRQKLQEKREEIQKERVKLLEEEKRMFAQQRSQMTSEDSDEETTSNSSSALSESEHDAPEPQGHGQGQVTEANVGRKKKLIKRRKKPKKGELRKLDTSKLKFDVLERQRLEKERWKIQEHRRKLLEEEKRMFEEARRQRIEHQEEDAEDVEIKSSHSDGPRKLEYSKTRFDIMAQHKMEEERQRIREERAQLLREEKRLFEEENEKLKEQEEHEEEAEERSSTPKKQKSSKKPNRLDKSFTEFDILAKKKKEEESDKIMRESQNKLEEEKRMFREAKKMMEEEEHSEDELDAEMSLTRRSPQRLSSLFTDFEEMEKRRKREEREEAYHDKLYQLEQEKKSFAEARRLQEESDSECEETGHKRKSIPPNRHWSVLTNFEETEKERMKSERMNIQERRIKKMEEELKRFQEEREKMNDSDKEERSEIASPQVKQPRPKKLSSSFTKFDEIARMRQEEGRSKMREEKARELAEERRSFQESKEAEDQSESESDDDHHSESKIHRPINRLNVRQQMEAVLQAQRDIEQKRIMETKFCRMTVEQQEMYLAKESQLQILQEKLERAQEEYEDEKYTSSEYTDEETESSEESRSEASEENRSYKSYQEDANDVCNLQTCNQMSSADENSRYSSPAARNETSTPGSNDSGYTGAPWFTDTLTNVTLTEGKPVRFDAVIQADPHPKVTWYFKNRLIRNSPDYQYMNKGTQYSLYMNESFLDDTGEYLCKAENGKGIATSKAILTVIVHCMGTSVEIPENGKICPRLPTNMVPSGTKCEVTCDSGSPNLEYIKCEAEGWSSTDVQCSANYSIAVPVPGIVDVRNETEIMNNETVGTGDEEPVVTVGMTTPFDERTEYEIRQGEIPTPPSTVKELTWIQSSWRYIVIAVVIFLVFGGGGCGCFCWCSQ